LNHIAQRALNREQRTRHVTGEIRSRTPATATSTVRHCDESQEYKDRTVPAASCPVRWCLNYKVRRRPWLLLSLPETGRRSTQWFVRLSPTSTSAS